MHTSLAELAFVNRSKRRLAIREYRVKNENHVENREEVTIDKVLYRYLYLGKNSMNLFPPFLLFLFLFSTSATDGSGLTLSILI